MWEGIDISQFNGEVNFDRVKAAGKSFVMVRAGWCGYDGSIQEDSRFSENMRGAAQAGLETGVYLYNYAKSTEAARIAAGNLLEMIQPYRVSYPVALDMEDSSLQPLGKEQLTEIARSFLRRVEDGKYYATLYTSYGWLNSFLLPGQLTQFDWWIADWRQGIQPQPQWGMWQYMGNQGRVDGVNGPCDLDCSFKNYPAICEKYGLNGLSQEGDGSPDPSDLLAQIIQLRQEAEQWKEKYQRLEEGLRELLDTGR